MTIDRRKPQRMDHYAKMIRITMEEPAWRALSATAQSLYPWLKLEWHGPKHNNNGKIKLSVRQAALAMGVQRDTAARAFQDLQAKGFIVQTAPACLGTEGAAKSPCYEITELGMPGGAEGRKLYRNWKSDEEFLVIKVCANNPSGRNGIKTPSRKT